MEAAVRHLRILQVDLRINPQMTLDVGDDEEEVINDSKALSGATVYVDGRFLFFHPMQNI